jgi:hypothetical protein
MFRALLAGTSLGMVEQEYVHYTPRVTQQRKITVVINQTDIATLEILY